MSNFVKITLRDANYSRQMEEASQYLARILPSARVSKDSVVAAILARHLQHRLVDERYIDARYLPKDAAKLVKHLLNNIEVTEHGAMPELPAMGDDVQVVIDKYTKHVHYQPRI